MFVHFQQTFFFLFSSPTLLVFCVCVVVCVKVKFMVSQRKIRKKSSVHKLLKKNCATIADKTNTFVASKRNVHKERFGRNVKIFVKMPTLYNSQRL